MTVVVDVDDNGGVEVHVAVNVDINDDVDDEVDFERYPVGRSPSRPVIVTDR